MTHKNKSRFLSAILLLTIVALLAAVLTPRLINQPKVGQTLPTNPRDKEIAKLEAIMAEIKDKDSQEYKKARRDFCLLTARPETERAKAIANIREFLHGIYPAVSKEFEPEFICSKFNSKPDNAGTDYNSPTVEFYEAENHRFEVDPQTNYILGFGEAERRWGTNEDGTRWFEPAPEYDYSGIYTKPEELRQVVERFLTEHKSILGIDLAKMTYEFEGTKPGNFFLKWKAVDENGKAEELVSVTITNGGQIIVYDNDTYDLAKNGR